MSNVPWHHRPAIIVALLVVLPPVGIILMWMRLPWAHKTRLAVSGVAGAWLVVLLVLGNAHKGTEDRGAPPIASATAGTPTTKHTPTTQAATPPTAPPTRPGLSLIEDQPLLLIPTNLDGFSLASGTVLPPKVTVGANASYIGENEHLVAHVNVNKADVKHEPDEGLTAIKVGDHDGTIGEDKVGKTISIAWGVNGWNGLVIVDYERSVDRSAAEKAVQALAPKVAALLDSYLTGTPPSATDRQQQLATIIQATSTSRVQAFMSKVENAGITADVLHNASIKGDPNELIVTVGPTWPGLARQDRLVAAQKLWQVWADINTPTDMDTSRIKLVDVSGNQVGGSGVMGSSVKVDK